MRSALWFDGGWNVSEMPRLAVCGHLVRQVTQSRLCLLVVDRQQNGCFLARGG